MAAINLPIVSKFVDKGVKEAQGAFGGLSKSLGKLGGTIAAAFSVTAITSFVSSSIQGAEAAAIASRRLGQVAESMGIFGEQTAAVTKRLSDYAEANEFNLAVDADVIKATQAKLLTFKELALTADSAGGAFDRATQAAVDLAAAGFGQAESNAVQLGKALNDPIKGITALTRSGITFTAAEKEKIKTLTESGQVLEAQNMILEAIETQVGGTAEATASASERIKLAFNAVKDGVGEALLPAFEELSKAIVPIAQEVAPELNKAFVGLAPVFSTIAELIPLLVRAVLPIIPIFTSLVKLVADLAVQVFPILIAILEAAMSVLSAILPILGKFLEDLIEPLIPAVMTLVEAFMPLIEGLLPIFVELLNTLLPVITQLLLDVILPLAPAFVTLVQAILPLLTTILPPLVEILNTLLIPALQFAGAVMVALVDTGINFLKSGLTTLSDFMTPFAKAFTDVWRNISSTVKGIINGILGFIQGMVNGVIDGVNAVIRAINSIRVDIPSWIPMFGGQSFGFNLPQLGRVNIPRLAEGGIVMPQPGGVLANLAEAGKPEAVIPLDRLGGMGDKTVNYNITVNAGMGADGQDLGRVIVDQILRYERSSGRVFARA